MFFWVSSFFSLFFCPIHWCCCCFCRLLSLLLTLQRTNVMEMKYTEKAHTYMHSHFKFGHSHVRVSDVDIYNMESVLILTVDAGHWTNFIRLSFSLVMCVMLLLLLLLLLLYVLISILFSHFKCCVLFNSHCASIMLKPKQYTTIKWSARIYTKKKTHIRVKILRPRTLSNTRYKIKKGKNF